MVDVSSNRNTECPPRKCFRCVSEDPMIAKCPKPPKDNEERRRKVRSNKKSNRECDNDGNNDDHKIYASMERMSSNNERKSETSGVMWHVAPESKTQLVNCKLSLYFSLERSSLLDIFAIDVYILWSS